MPELPEVETTRIGIAPYVVGELVTDVIVREKRLRWPVPNQLKQQLTGQTINRLQRRAKYLLFYTKTGCMLLHLGMSGSLRILEKDSPFSKHDHVDIVFESERCLRLRDPRRFGSIHWIKDDPFNFKLINHLGPEPLSDNFNGDYLFKKSRGRKQTIKTFIMDSRIIVGVGNIYANETLFAAHINPKRKAGNISRQRYIKLADAIKNVLGEALKQGGTTLRDFVNSNGQPGYFRYKLQVYGLAEKPCINCAAIIKLERIGQRSTFYCPRCQR